MRRQSAPRLMSKLPLPPPQTCTACHDTIRSGYANTAHASVGRDAKAVMGREACTWLIRPITSFPPATGRGVRTMSLEFAELQKANHTDPLPFGYYEPSSGRLTSCYKCHYTQGYIGAVEQTAKPFNKFSYFPLTRPQWCPRTRPMCPARSAMTPMMPIPAIPMA